LRVSVTNARRTAVPAVDCKGRGVAGRLVLAAFLPRRACGDDERMWRYWTAADGLPETFTAALTVTPNGQVWARHGAVSWMSVLDGYGVTLIPENRLFARDDQLSRRVYLSSGAQPGLPPTRAWRNSSTARGSSATGQPRTNRAGGGSQRKRVLVLFSDSLREYDPVTRAWTDVAAARDSKILPFNRMVTGWKGALWISGEQGLGRLTIQPGAAGYQWRK